VRDDDLEEVAMCTRRILSVIVAVLLASSCSGDEPSPATAPTVPAQRREYAQIDNISSTFLDTWERGISRPDGYDATGVELWNSYRDAKLAIRAPSSLDDELENEEQVTELIEATKALFVYAYSTGIADEMIARSMEEGAYGIAVESATVTFEDGRPAAIGELDLVLQRDGCDEIRGEYHVWLGQTNIDEISGRASAFARYALDQAAAAGCDWAIIELVGQALNISSLHN
jgi:hypothetical protein